MSVLESAVQKAAAAKPLPPGQMVEENLLPTPNSVDLSRSPRSEYMLRFDRRSPHVAELFQENTKLAPQSPFGPSPRDHELAQAKAWYFATAYRVAEDALEPGMAHVLRLKHAELPGPLGRLCGACGPGGPLASWLYGVDLMVLHSGRLVRVVPEADFVWVEKRFRPEEEETLRASVLRLPAEAVTRARAFVFAIGAPWRHMMFLGPRGYRHMMVELGAVLAGVQGIATQLRLAPRLALDFYDARLDRLLLLDGVERTTLGVVTLEGDAL